MSFMRLVKTVAMLGVKKRAGRNLLRVAYSRVSLFFQHIKRFVKTISFFAIYAQPMNYLFKSTPQSQPAGFEALQEKETHQ